MDMDEISTTSADRPAMVLYPSAGQFRKEPKKLELVRRVAMPYGTLRQPASLSELTAWADDLYRTRPSRLFIIGGDGTISRVLSVLFNVYGEEPLPRLTLIPAGTVNLAASRLSIRGNVVRLIEESCTRFCRATIRQPSLRVSFDNTTCLGFTLGTGLVSRFFETYGALKNPGNTAALVIFLRTFCGSFFGSRYSKRIFSPVAATLSTPEETYGSLDLSLLVCSVFRNVGLGLRPNYRAGSQEGCLHLVASTLAPQILGPSALRVLLGLPLRKHAIPPELIDVLTSAFTLQFKEPTAVVLDGDLHWARVVSVSPGPELQIDL